MSDQLEELIKKAHAICNRTSIFEVMDLDRTTAFMRLINEYGPPADRERLEQYLSILDEIREFEASPGRSRMGQKKDEL